MSCPYRVFITGVTGSLGKAVTKILLEDPRWVYEITGYSRCEHRQKQMPNADRITMYLGDIRDRDRLTEASRGADVIFHFAALKHVDLLETNPEESIRTNIEGTMNVLYAQRINRVRRVVLSSTDKAVDPINVYGASKMVAEKLVLRNPNNVVCRYGNVLASNGSVIPLFVKSLLNEKRVLITDERMTRFLIRLPDAAKFVLCHGLESPVGGLFVPEMKATKITTLAKAVAQVLKIKRYTTTFTGMRAGEKLHERLVSEHSGKNITSENCDQFSFNELVALIEPSVRALL